MEKHRIIAEHATRANTRDLKKPNEDKIIADEENGIYILLDGITRPHGEYEQSPYQSAACRVNEVFADAVYRRLLARGTEESVRQALRSAVELGNAAIADYRGVKTEEEWQFYPATLGIIAVTEGDKLCYYCAGDCLGVLLRGSSRLLFGRQQVLEAVDMLGVTKKERYGLYCNKPRNKLSYAVFNGDSVAAEGGECSFITLYPGDTVLLASDGIAGYLKYERVDVLRASSTAEMLDASTEYDRPPFAKYADDKSVIKLDVLP
ncbi:MAG: hypothetical protein IKK83_03935 [Clostridia bacterium]|nr:hypothetical protein [Clostridia bacterium]